MTRNLLRLLTCTFILAATAVFAQEAVDRKEEIAELKAKLDKKETEKDDRHLIEKQIARSYLALEDFDNAIIHLQNSINLQEKPAVQEYMALGRLLIQTEKLDDATGLLEAGQKLYPDSMDIAFLLTFPLRYQEKWQEAVKQYESIEALAETQTPTGLNHEIYFQYGAAVERTGDIDKAAQLFQKALERIPDGSEQSEFRATVLNYLGYMWVENNKNIDVAGELIKKAAKLDPESGAIADSLGWYYFKKERYIEAMNELVRAEAMMEDRDHTVMDHIAQTFYKIGNKKEAVTYMEKAIELEPGNQEYKKRLKEYSQK
ncbi:MAG: tetratricopeptide repeat protein [Verrucomicrobiales bacterium]|nr:tetratricopeptide repeat protein [Verrucomicrobiales bacterium]